MALVMLVAWRQQAIAWTNVDLPSLWSRGIYLMSLLQDLKPPISKTKLEIAV